MINFQYTRARDVADAVRQIAADPTAKFIAGGTNLIDLMEAEGGCGSARSYRIPTSPITR